MIITHFILNLYFFHLFGILPDYSQMMRIVEVENPGDTQLLNKELIKVVDVRYGKPYEENTPNECDSFIFELIPNSKNEIEKLIKSGIY